MPWKVYLGWICSNKKTHLLYLVTYFSRRKIVTVFLRIIAELERKIIEQFSKPRFFTEFDNWGFFSAATQQGRKGRGIFKSRKKCGFESCSNISFPLKLRQTSIFQALKTLKKKWKKPGWDWWGVPLTAKKSYWCRKTKEFCRQKSLHGTVSNLLETPTIHSIGNPQQAKRWPTESHNKTHLA